MHVSTSVPAGRSWLRSPEALAFPLLLSVLLGGCGGSSGGNGQSGIPGEEGPKPGGGFFFVDENESGGASKLLLAEVLWGRLVDIHEIDSLGARVEEPVFTDFVIEPGILTTASSYVLDRNPVTQRERLTIQAQKTNLPPNGTSDAFDQLLEAATDALPVVVPKNDDGSSAAPFTTVPRNACVVLRFADCLDDGGTATLNLINTVKVFTGYPPVTPFSARIVFDPNHGAVVGGDFHSTRVLVDMTTSESEASALPVAQGVNAIGLPTSLTSSSATNVSVRVPSQTDIGSGQSEVLTNLAGVSLDAPDSSPFDPNSLTFDVVRALRSGNSSEASNGFLTDLDRPRVIGAWPAIVTDAEPDTAVGADAGLDFLLDLSFSTSCASAPVVGDVITVGGSFLEVTSAAGLSGSDVVDLGVRAAAFVSNPLTLQGAGLYQAPYDAASPLAVGCWVSFLPEASTFPVTGVSTTAQIVARFSEPMDPETLSPFGGFLVVEGASGASSTANSSRIVVGQVLANSDLTEFSFEPSSPYPHLNGASEPLHLELGEARDLAGNRLRNALPFVDFALDPLSGTENNGAVVLRFGASDEYAPNGGNTDGFLDLRGQFNYSSNGSIRPRPVAFGGWPVDRNNPVPAFMTAVPNGVFPPLVPLGAKLQMLWRYCDLGWEVRDETKYNLDVIGMSWSPIGGLVVADFYDQFEIRLGHSRFLPDEAFPVSGLPASPNPFEDNYLAGSNPKIVHNRALGYTINPANLFNTPAGTPMMPFPLNRGSAPDVTYTWRDTSILTLGADGDTLQPGIPLAIEGTVLVNQVPVGSIADFGEVPSFGLPLLIEIKCHPSDQGLGLNRFDSSNANLPPLVTPNFRAYSAGGINNFGNPVIVLPDTETFPRGGYNPAGNPPGSRTLTNADNTFYLGQLDTVVRVSRVHTVWLDAGLNVTPLWQNPVLEPSLAAQPAGTNILFDFRSAAGFSGSPPINAPFNAAVMDVYGNEIGNPNPTAPPTSLTDWSSNISVGDGQRYLQVRMTFVNNISTGVSPELSALALPFDF